MFREFFIPPPLLVLVDVLNPDPLPLREGGAAAPFMVGAPERDAARLHVDHPLLTEFWWEPLPDARVHLGDDFLEPELHLIRSDLELVDESVDLVDETDGPHAFRQRQSDGRFALLHDAFCGAV